jgi:hypothetical protein
MLENNIKMGLQEVGWRMDWIDLTQDRDRRRTCVNAVENFSRLTKCVKFID